MGELVSVWLRLGFLCLLLVIYDSIKFLCVAVDFKNLSGSLWACLQLCICTGISVRVAKKEQGGQWSQWSVEALWADSWVGFLGMGH